MCDGAEYLCAGSTGMRRWPQTCVTRIICSECLPCPWNVWTLMETGAACRSSSRTDTWTRPVGFVRSHVSALLIGTPRFAIGRWVVLTPGHLTHYPSTPGILWDYLLFLLLGCICVCASKVVACSIVGLFRQIRPVTSLAINVLCRLFEHL